MSDLQVTKAVRIAAPLAEVWAWLTEPDRIERWLNGTRVDTSWQVGAPLVFSGIWQGMRFRAKGVVLAFESLRRLQYSQWSRFWRLPDVPENYAVVTMAVTADGDDTILEVTHGRFPLETDAKHANFHWTVTLPVLKDLIESSRGPRAEPVEARVGSTP